MLWVFSFVCSLLHHIIILYLNDSLDQKYAHVNNFSKFHKHTVVKCDAIMVNDIKQNIFGGESSNILKRVRLGLGRDSSVTCPHFTLTLSFP